MMLKVLMDEGQGAAGDIEENPNQGFRVLADHSRKAQLKVKVGDLKLSLTIVLQRQKVKVTTAHCSLRTKSSQRVSR